MPAHSQLPERHPWPQWMHLVAAVVLLLAAAALDVFRPFSRGFSIFYLAPVLYAGWALRGWVEIIFDVTVFAAALLVPGLRLGWAGIGGVNRLMGAAVGLLVFILVRERRRYADALALSKEELEAKVKERTAELERLNAEFQRVITVKDQFLSNMSHEIRTPLNGILGMAELLAEAPGCTDQRAVIVDLHTSSQALRSMVDDILDFSRLEAGRLQLHQAPFSLRATIGEVVAMVRTEASRLGIHVVSDPLDLALDRVVGDQVRIRQVLTNLVGNAIKFTAQGFIRIGVRPVDQPPGAESLLFCFSVEDTGIGIPADALDRVFDKFTQLDSSNTRRYGGAGLGLAICKHLVDLMHGQIGVRSTVGKGSTFWFTVQLPVLLAPSDDAAPAALQDSEPLFPGLRAAIAEDNAINRRLLARLLEKLGCDVVAAASGSELLVAAAQSRFDIVFMDLHMPDLDGLETTRALRRQETAGEAHAVVVAVTASVMEQDREACLAAGMDDFLPKPISLEMLRRTLTKWSPSYPVLPGAGRL
ncbi:MAG: response regulator [Bryobacterales bacterium]|nr:response regulator [Bryobacterales bacterium]